MRARVVAIVVALAGLAAACGGSPEPSVAPAPATTSVPAATPDPTPTGPPAAAAAEALAATGAATPAPSPTPQPTAKPEPTPTPQPTATPQPTPEPLPSGCGRPAEPGAVESTLDFQGRSRSFWTVVPVGYDPTTPTPLVLNWHGFGSTGSQQLFFSDYEQLANDNGFIVVAATGLPGPDTNQNSWDVFGDIPGRDDLQFANDLLDRVVADLCVDEQRVYSTGFSNGGVFTSHLVCEMSERIAAAVTVAAVYHPDDCRPDRVVPFMAFHGTDDRVVAYAERGIDRFADFAADAGCDADPVETMIGQDVTELAYAGCVVEMIFFRIDGGGHTWPGSRQSLATSESAGLGVTTNDIVATQVSWDFFSRHTLDD